MATTTKTAYLVYSGDYADNCCLSRKLCNRARAEKRVAAAIRMGYKNAYMTTMSVSRDSRLLGDKTRKAPAAQGLTAAERDALKRYAAAYDKFLNAVTTK